MAWWNRKKKETPPNWKMSPFTFDDFLVDSLDNYTDLHFNMVLSYVRDIIPQELRNDVFVAGGFACCFAGVTKQYEDIDLFCTTSKAFDAMVDIVRHYELKIKTDYVYSFIHEGFKFDLVNTCEEQSPGVNELLTLFDLNWSMVGIDLAQNIITCHDTTLSTIPQVNPSRIDICLEKTIKRITKYKDRLVRTPDMAAYKCLMQGLNSRLDLAEKMDNTTASSHLGY